jgi:hypothetical protein
VRKAQMLLCSSGDEVNTFFKKKNLHILENILRLRLSHDLMEILLD